MKKGHFEKSFREIGVAEFFRKNLHMLGYGKPIKSFTTVIHEYLTNALDACEEANILPEIYLEISKHGDMYCVQIKDNGPGIPEHYIGKVFGKMLTGTKFHRYIQSRGQQGIGATGAILFSQMTTGRPVRIVSSTGDRKIITIILEIDMRKNKARIFKKFTEAGIWRGLKIESYYKCVMYTTGEKGVLEYIKRTAISNPHAEIIFKDPDGKTWHFHRSINELPGVPKEMKPHPLGVLPDDLLQFAKISKAKKLSTFLIKDFSRISSDKARRILRIAKVLNIHPKDITYEIADKITQAIHILNQDPKHRFMAPPTEGLIPIGEAQIKKSLINIIKPEFIEVVERSPSVYRGGIPFQVELGIAYGTKDKKFSLMRFANRTPLLFDTGGCLITKSLKKLHWSRYEIKDIEQEPISIFINLISPHIPYTSTGKQSIAEDEDLGREIRNGLMELGRKIKKYLSQKRREREQKLKKAIYLRYIPLLAKGLSEITSRNKSQLEDKLKALISAKLGQEDNK